MKIVCNLDTCLVDTRGVTAAAYRQVGVEVSEDIIGRPWREWLPEYVALHEPELELREPTLGVDEKCQVIIKRRNAVWSRLLIDAGRPLSMLAWLIDTKKRVTALTLLGRYQIEALHAWGVPRSLRTVGPLGMACKADWLAKNGWGRYIDTDPETIALIKARTTWTVASPEEVMFEGAC